jgi:hypothetical protein
MKWFRKSLLLVSVVGSFGTSALAQEPDWSSRPPQNATARNVTLGRPGPLPAGAVDLSAPSAALRVIAETPPPIPPARAAPALAGPISGAAPPVWDSPPRAGGPGMAVRLTSFADSVPLSPPALGEEEPRPLHMPALLPAAEGGSPPVSSESRSAPLRWFFNPVAALQTEPAPLPSQTPGNDINIFVGPAPGSVSGPVVNGPAPMPELNPWTGAPLDGSVVGPADYGPQPEGLQDGAAFSGPGQDYRIYARGEALVWWVRGFYLPPLVTTSSANIPQTLQGLPGPGTTLLFGNTNSPSGPIPGARFTAGYFIDPCGLWAVEGTFFFLGRETGHFNADSSQFPVIARPFIDAATGQELRELTATPGGPLATDLLRLRGAIAVNTHSQLWGAEANVRRQLCCGCNYNVSGLAGFRYLDLREGVTIQETVVSAASLPIPSIFDAGNQITVLDSFQTHNRFYGGQLGLQGEMRRGRWSLWGSAKLGLGSNHQTISIAGSQTVVTLAGARETFNGGLLALPSNSGTFSREQISFVPEVGLKLGYNLTDNLRVFFGYDFLYWTNVVRPGDQIDTTLTSTQIPNFFIPPRVTPPGTPLRPVVPFRSTGFWAQGLNAGLEFRY